MHAASFPRRPQLRDPVVGAVGLDGTVSGARSPGISGFGSDAVPSRPTAPTTGSLSWGRRGKLAACIVATLMFVFVVLPTMTGGEAFRQNLRERFRPPSWPEAGGIYGLLGNDQLGRSVLALVVEGGREMLLTGAAAAVGAVAIAAMLRLVDRRRSRLLSAPIGVGRDISLTLPGFLFMATLVVTVLGDRTGSTRIPVTIVGVILIGWMLPLNALRGEIRSAQIARRAPALLFQTLAQVMVLLFALDFSNLGVQVPTVAWGLRVADGLQYMNSAWWIAVLPLAAFTLVVILLNLIGLLLEPQGGEV
jgi:peptide/nickel transport system permease protein